MPASRSKSKLHRPILAIDVGGGHVKIRVSNRRDVRRFESGAALSATDMVAQVRAIAGEWSYDAVSIGYPGVVVDGRIVCEPQNLGNGWVEFDFRRAFRRPVRIMNDATMQAIGSYKGGRMLFLGLGTGIGTVLIVNGVIHPMELAHLPFTRRGTFGTYAGDQARRRLGVTAWRKRVQKMVRGLSRILHADYVIIGGGNAARLDHLPSNADLGHNDLAFLGGFRVWRKWS